MSKFILILKRQLKDFFSAQLINFSFTFCLYVNYIFVAKKWKAYEIKWSQLNLRLKTLSIIDMNFKKTNMIIIRLVIFMFITTALSYTLFLVQAFSQISQCDELQQNVTLEQVLFEQNYPILFNVVPYHISFGIFIIVYDIIVSLAWIFNDLFIIMISLMIGKTFKMFNKRLSMNIAVSNLKFNYF